MNIFDLQATISLNADGFMSGVQNAQTAFSGLGDKVSAGTVALGTALGNMATKAAGAVVDFGKDSINTGMSFESAMSQIAATLGYTTDDIADNINGAGDNFDALKKKAAEMGRETNFTASQAAEGLNILAMSGFDAQQSISMIGDVLHLAAAGSMDMASAAGYISGSMKGFADETKDSAYYADLMAKGATLANTSVTQLGEAMSSGAAGAAAYSQSAESMTVALLRLAEQGVVGSAAGTALAAAMKDLYTPTDQAKKALDELGVAAYENGKALDFNDVVNDLSAALAGFSEEEANAYKQTIFGIQGLNAYNKMTVTGVEAQNNWTAALAGASEGMGEAAKQYDTMTSNLQGSKDMLSSALEGFQNAVYEHLAGPLTEATNLATSALSELTAGFEEGGLRGALESLGQFAADTFKGMWDNLKLPPELEGLSEVFENLKSALSGIKEAFQPFVDAVTGAFSETMPTVTSAVKEFLESFQDSNASGVIAPIAAGVSDLLSAFGTIAADVVEMVAGAITMFLSAFENSGVADVIGTIATGVGDLLSAFGGAAVDVVEGIASAIGSFMDAFDDETVADIISPIASGAQELFGAFGSVAANIIEDVGKNVGEFLGLFSESSIPGIIADIATHAGELLGHLQSAGAKVIEGVGNAVSGFLDAFNKDAAISLMGDVAGLIADLFAPFTEALGPAIEAAAEGFKKLAEKFGEFAGVLGNEIVSKIREIVDEFDKWGPLVLGLVAGFAAMKIVTEVSAGINALRTAMASGQIAANALAVAQNLLNAAMNANPIGIVVGLIAGLVTAFVAAYNSNEDFRNGVNATMETLKEVFIAVGEGIKEFFTNTLPAAFNAVIDWFKSLPATFQSIGEDLVNGIKDGFTRAWQSFTQSVKDLANGIVDSVKGLFGIHSPSKVFAGIGQNLVLGMEKGWNREFSGLERTVAEDIGSLSGTARLPFEDSAIGRSSAAGISSMLAANGSGRSTDPIEINLILDGDVAATALYDPLRRTAFQRGQNMEAVYA